MNALLRMCDGWMCDFTYSVLIQIPEPVDVVVVDDVVDVTATADVDVDDVDVVVASKSKVPT